MNINRQPAERATQLGSTIHSDLCGPVAHLRIATTNTISSVWMTGVDISGSTS